MRKMADFLLLQIRDEADLMRQHERDCFARVLQIRTEELEVFDLLNESPSTVPIAGRRGILVGGSGNYSAAGQGRWLDRALETLRRVCDSGIPVFGSCWGFQAIARALGGQVIHDPDQAEVGTQQLELTGAGLRDEAFGLLGSTFMAQMGHEDHVVELPDSARLLASSHRVTNQAFRLADRPVYATQFHPELNREAILARLRTYPRYVEQISGLPFPELAKGIRDTPATEQLILRCLAIRSPTDFTTGNER